MSVREQAAIYAAALASTPWAAWEVGCDEIEHTLGVGREAAKLMWATYHSVMTETLGLGSTDMWAEVESRLRCS